MNSEELQKQLEDMHHELAEVRAELATMSVHMQYMKQYQEEQKKRWWAVTLSFLSSVIAFLLWFFTGGKG